MKIPSFNKESKNSKPLLVKLTVGLATICLVAFVVVPLISRSNIYTQFKKLEQVMSMAVQWYFEDVDVEKLTESAIRGMLRDLDPHSTYLTAEDLTRANEEISGSFEGIGISFSVMSDTLVVESPIEDGPSERVGIIARDRIVNVDGNSIVGIGSDSIRKLLRGPKGTIVQLGVHRPGTRGLLNFTVTRDKIPIYSVDAYFIVDGTDIGYISINNYAQTTHRELVAAGNKLREQGMKRLILDLRNNGGGLLDQAGLVADEFLKGDTIVYTRGRRADDQVFVARAGQTMEDIPLIVLINAGSASASEITAGAIQDLDRGLVVGVTSFGKGLVQRQLPIHIDGSAVRLTVARFYTASGRCIQRPFKDIEAWRRLSDRLELEEGANLEHTLDKIKREEADKEKSAKRGNDTSAINLDSIEIFRTRSGRPVLGGGGITPDYIVRHDSRELTALSSSLWRNGVFGEFVDKYVAEMKKKYGDDYRKFGEEFKLSNSMIKELKKIAKEKNIEWNEEEFEKDRDWYENRQLKSLLARAIWNSNTARRITISSDRQLNRALELFPLAEKIQKRSK